MTFRLTTTQTARKQHQCESCRRTIEPGETYDKYTAIDPGEFTTYKECAHCNALAILWRLFSWTYAEGYDYDTFADFGRDAARDTMRDARWYVQWTRQWRRRDGTLYPIPSVPREEAA